MAKGLRSNRKKALRTIRRHEVATSTPYKDREAERHARMQKTQEAGKAFRELAQQKREQPVAEEPEKTGREQPAESMEVEVKSLEPGTQRRGILLTKKKRLKLQRKKKADGINSLHRRKGKMGKRK